ncbi:MAG: hypothetical protein EOP38_31635, partial [Rubrivivax sp.]
MGPHTSAVREVLQWLTELDRNKQARGVELGGEAPENTKLVTYVRHATALRQMKGDAVEGAVGKVAELDQQHFRERVEKDKKAWREFLGKQGACKGKGAFNAAAELVKQAGSASELGDAQRLLAQARKLLLADPPETLKSGDIPGVTAVPKPRVIDKAQALKALKHKDLDMLIARNDTWGNFDPARALGKSATEEDLKVLLNVIESAIAAEEKEAAWKDYETKATKVIEERGHELPEPIKVYKEVILGAGASAAYYIVSNYGQFDMHGTMVLGELQPWAEERGKFGGLGLP